MSVQDNLNAAWHIAKLEREVESLRADLKAANASRAMLKRQRNALQLRVFQLLGLAPSTEE